MSDLLLAIVTAITNLLGPAAGPLTGGLPIVALLTLIALGSALLPAAARADHTQGGGHRG